MESQPKGRCNCCSAKTKYMLGRCNKLMIVINLIIFIVFIAMGANGLGKLNGLAGSGYEAVTDVASGITGLFALAAAIFFVVVIFFSCWTVCCYNYCCCCLVLWVPVTLVLAIILAALAGIIARYQNSLTNTVCDAARAPIKEFWDDFVDGRMCSDVCPCTSTGIAAGGYLTRSDLGVYGTVEKDGSFC